MIVYYKLANILKEKNMTWKDLTKSGISINTPTSLSKNKYVSTETIDKICSFLKVQPSEIMEWVSQEEYESQNAEKIQIEKQIAELQAKLKKM